MALQAKYSNCPPLVKTGLAVRTAQMYHIVPAVGNAHFGRLFGHFKADPVFTSLLCCQFTCSRLTGFCVAGILPTWPGTKTRGCSSATCSDVILLPLPLPRVSTKSAPRSVPSPPAHKQKAVRPKCDDDDDDDDDVRCRCASH